MSNVFDKLQNYSSNKKDLPEKKYNFDNNTIEGYFYNKLEEEGFELSEIKPILDESGDLLIVSGAGSGKTTCLIFKLAKDIVTGDVTKVVQLPNGNPVRAVDSVWVSTFLKSGASELRSTLRKWQRKFGYYETGNSIKFSTIHAEFKSALNEMGVKTDLLNGAESSRLIKKSIDALAITRGGKPLSKEDYRIIEGIITYTRNKVHSDKYDHPSMQDYELSKILLDGVIDNYARRKQEMGRMDFEDLQELIYKYLYITPNQAVIDFIANRYKYIYLDEFQDTSQIQYEIIKVYAKERGKIVAIGDDDQAIYSWRGSDIRIINEQFEKDFEPKVENLSLNYRCPSSILDPVVPSIEMNTLRHKKKLRSFKEGGDSGIMRASSSNQMLDLLTNNIVEDLRDRRSVGVLCRTNFDGVLPALALELSGKCSYSISSDKMTLSSPLPRRVFNSTSLFTSKHSNHVTSTLQMVAGRYDFWAVKDFVDNLKNTNLTIWNVDLKDVEYSVPSIHAFLKKLREVKEEKGELEALNFLFMTLKSTVYGGTSSFELSARSYVDALLAILNTREFLSVADFCFEVNEINDKMKARVDNKKAHVKIATVHEFKGKEVDSVYGWNVVDDVFPSVKADKTNIYQMEEERRIFYILCTRAKKKLRLMTREGYESPFLAETNYVTLNKEKIGGSVRSDTKEKVDEVLKEVADETLRNSAE